MKQRDIRMDLLRILASFLVVVIHTCSGLFPIDAVGTELFWASDLFNSCSRIAVPLFVMLSGAFLLDPARPFQTRAFFKANVLHIAASYLFWASLYAILDMRVHANGFSPFKTVIIFISTVLSGFGHLWFMPLLLGLYLLVPLLRKICESRQLTVYRSCFVLQPILSANCRLSAKRHPRFSPASGCSSFSDTQGILSPDMRCGALTFLRSRESSYMARVYCLLL